MIQKIPTPYGRERVYTKKGTKASGRIMVVPGFSESLSHNRELVDMLADREFDTFTFSQPRRKAGGSSVLSRNRNIILSILKATTPEGQKVHAVAHSFGSTSLLKAALNNPDSFAGLILM